MTLKVVTNLAALRPLVVAQRLVLVQADQVLLLIDQGHPDHLHPAEAEDQDKDGDGDQLPLGPRPVGVDEREVVPVEDRHCLLLLLNELEKTESDVFIVLKVFGSSAAAQNQCCYKDQELDRAFSVTKAAGL